MLMVHSFGTSPLGRGFLTGAIKSVDDLPEGDIRRDLTRFGEDYIKHNLRLVEELKEIATKKGCTPGQLSIAWVGSLGPKVIPLPGSSCVLSLARTTAYTDRSR